MKINVEENLIESNKNNSYIIDDEINEFLDKDEGKSIKADIELLNNMGFDKKMINKVYILLRPENIERAIDYMTEINGIYQHDFIPSTNPNEKLLCFICKKPNKNHLDYIPDDSLIDVDLNNNHINNNIIIGVKNIDNEDDLYDECEVCYEKIEDKELNKIPCGHLFCTQCWFNYLKTLITEAKVEKIKCMNHECDENISEEYILKYISQDKNLIDKYKKFKKRMEIFKDENKKLCPKPDCDSFLQKSKESKYVKCEYGHKYCFDCLRPPHGKDSCDNNLEKQLVKWTKGKRVKRWPRCKIYTEKNEGCNHMTCVSCKYQWCWLCEGEYKYGHYGSGKCQGQQFTKADFPKKISNNKENCNFGIHRIFRCIYRRGPIPLFNSGALLEKYLIILIFWLFGIALIFAFIINEFSSFDIHYSNYCIKNFVNIIGYLTGITLFVSFQITFICLTAPFILICLIYHNFFNIFLMFLGFELRYY